MFENAVKQKKILSGNAFPLEKADLHIAFGISANFTYPVSVLMTSILENNNNLQLAFHIFADNSISVSEQDKFSKILEKYNTSIMLYKIDNSTFQGLDNAEFTIATYYRFAIPYQLKDITDRYLYLDADMICLNSLQEFVDLDFNHKIAAVVEDFRLDKNGKPLLTSTNTGYFNAGMMYINLKEWIQQQVSEKCVELLRAVNANPELKKKYGYEFRCFDQDALNVIIKDSLKHLQPRCNFICNISLSSNKFMIDVPKDTIILHYTGFNKPWHEWCFHPLARYFRKYWQISPWNNTPLDTKPSKYRQMRLYAKYFAKQGKYFKMLYWSYKSVVKKYT